MNLTSRIAKEIYQAYQRSPVEGQKKLCLIFETILNRFLSMQVCSASAFQTGIIQSQGRWQSLARELNRLSGQIVFSSNGYMEYLRDTHYQVYEKITQACPYFRLSDSDKNEEKDEP